MDGQWTPGQPLEGRSCPSATHQQTLSGKAKLTYLSVCISGLYPSVVSKKRLPVSHSALFFFPFKVVIEGLVDGKSWGDIAVDDIKVLDGLSMSDCKGEALSLHSI